MLYCTQQSGNYHALSTVTQFNLLLRTWKYVLTDRLLMVSFPIHCEIGYTIDWAHKPCNAKCYHIKGCRKSKLKTPLFWLPRLPQNGIAYAVYHLKKCYIISLSFTITALIKLSQIVIASWYIWKLPLQDAWHTNCSQIQNSTVFFLPTCMKKYQRNTIKTIT